MERRDNIKIDGHVGTWYIIDETIHLGKRLYLLESEIYGEDAPSIIVEDNLNIILENVYNGFLDYYESIA